MVYRINKYSANTPKFGVLRDAFSHDEVERIKFLEKILTFTKGKVGPAQSEDDTARDSKIAFMGPNESTDWIYARLAGIVPKVNYDLFLLDVDQIEILQYTIYEATNEQHYEWHLDCHADYRDYDRKISGTLMLSDPSEYEGGELEIIVNGSPDKTEKLKPEKGHIAFFSSAFPHKVHPVTSGTRKSIVFWVLGKRES